MTVSKTTTDYIEQIRKLVEDYEKKFDELLKHSQPPFTPSAEDVSSRTQSYDDVIE